MNPLFHQLNGGQGNDIVSRFNKFRQSFKGDPQQQVQQLLNSGKVSQADYDRAVRQARYIQSIMKNLT